MKIPNHIKSLVVHVLQYSSAISVLFAVASYFWEAPDRQKQKHYQAWQVINTAQGRGGSGGRIEALQELNADKVPLVGVDVSNAFLFGIRVRKASMARSTLNGADARESDWEGTNFDFANMNSANFRHSNLRGAQLQHARLEDCDLNGADLRGANLNFSVLDEADLRNSDLAGVKWAQIESVAKTNIYGVRNAPEGFIEWALKHGAVADKDVE